MQIVLQRLACRRAKESPTRQTKYRRHQLKVYGEWAIGCAIAWGLAIVGTLIILKICDVAVGLRVDAKDEVQGLDLSQHGEEGYIMEA